MRFIYVSGAALLGITLSLAASGAEPPASPATVVPLLTQSLPNIEGKEVTMVTVEYAPGGASTEHRHNANTFVYVLEGSVVMQVAGGPLQTLTVGQTFYETPTDIHTISRNASTTQKAKILVFFVKEKGAPATVPMN
jgi:quercetin dioxygenase-like cupin family protein